MVKEHYYENVAGPNDLDYISNYNLHLMTPTKVCIISIYFAITSLSTVGFGDFVP